MDEWIKKDVAQFMQWGLSHKKESNNVIFSDVNGHRDCHTEQSQT